MPSPSRVAARYVKTAARRVIPSSFQKEAYEDLDDRVGDALNDAIHRDHYAFLDAKWRGSPPRSGVVILRFSLNFGKDTTRFVEDRKVQSDLKRAVKNEVGGMYSGLFGDLKDFWKVKAGLQRELGAGWWVGETPGRRPKLVKVDVKTFTYVDVGFPVVVEPTEDQARHIR